MKKNTKNKGISRIDSGSTHGWFVRGYRNGKTYSKLFSDKKCGGKNKALTSAQEYRDDLYGELEAMPKKPRKRRLVFRDSRNKTGIIGVTRTVRKTTSGKISESYSVSWRPAPGIQKCTSYSIRKYGEKKAFKLAVAHRRRMMREAHGSSVLKQLDEAAAEYQELLDQHDWPDAPNADAETAAPKVNGSSKSTSKKDIKSRKL